MFTASYHGIRDWRFNHEEQGHRWMGGYVNGTLVTVRCARCDKEPIEVLRTDFTSEPCRRETH